MKVEIRLKETSQPIVIEGAENTYTKGPLYCVYVDGRVRKVPVADIFDVWEDYSA